MTTADNYPNPLYAWYAMTVLTVLYTISFIDRLVLSLLVDPIRESLDISDTQISLLHGFAFALFYSFFALPISRLADITSRVSIIAAGSVIWTSTTAACGLAQSYWQIFVARIGVGIGEASLSPSAYSLSADYFNPRVLPKAMSFYSSGIFVGSGLALLFGGAVITFLPPLSIPGYGTLELWQSTFVYVAIPGMVTLLLFRATVREPPRKQRGGGVGRPSVKETLAYVAARRPLYLMHWLGFSMIALVWTGLAAWQPTFFIRTFGWSPGEVGFWLGLSNLLFAPLGTMSGGWLAQRWLQRGRRDANILVGFVSGAGVLVFGIAAHLVPNASAALVLTILYLYFVSMPWGAAPAALQSITPNRMRSMISAMFLFFINILGIGTGPTVVALFTDHLFADGAMLRFSMAITVAVAIPVGMAMLLACRKRYVAEVRAWEDGGG